MFVGCRAGSVTTELWRFPNKSTRIVHIDSDPEVIGASYRTEAAIVGDARLSLSALNKELSGRHSPPKFGAARAIAPIKAQKWQVFRNRAAKKDVPIRPEAVIAGLQSVLDEDAIIVADPGTPCPYVSAYYEIRRTGRSLITNRAHGALGYALSAAVGAAIGAPERKTVALMGDGSFGFTCGELETVVRSESADNIHCLFKFGIWLDQSRSEAQFRGAVLLS